MSYDPSYTTDTDREVLEAAARELSRHPDFLENLDVRDAETGNRTGFVVRLRGGRELAVALRTDGPTDDTWDDRDWDGTPPPVEPFFDDRDCDANRK